MCRKAVIWQNNKAYFRFIWPFETNHTADVALGEKSPTNAIFPNAILPQPRAIMHVKFNFIATVDLPVFIPVNETLFPIQCYFLSY